MTRTVYVSLNADVVIINTADPAAAASQPIASQLYGHLLAADSCSIIISSTLGVSGLIVSTMYVYAASMYITYMIQ